MVRALAVSQGYTTQDANLQKGMVAALTKDSTSASLAVQSAEASDPDKVVGVVVDKKDSLVTLGSSGSQVFVATSGQAQAYVSDQGGVVKKGDLLTLSPLKGVLMKANSPGLIKVVGIALEDFSTKPAQPSTVKDDKNKPATVHIALVDIEIGIKSTSTDSASQSILQQFGQSITGHYVSGIRVISALTIFIILLIVEGTMAYGAISSGITSVGRNPLAKKMIIRQLSRSFFIEALFLLIGGAVIVIILWL